MMVPLMTKMLIRINYFLTKKIMKNRQNTLTPGSSQPEVFNVLGQMQTIERVEEERKALGHEKRKLSVKHPNTENKDKQIYFLCAMPRSGNTLFASIMNQNPDIAVTATVSLWKL